MTAHENFHEVWWIWAPERHPWGGARIANFRKMSDGKTIFFISNEPSDRIGVRFWDECAQREGWVKVKQIPLPTQEEVMAAVDEAMRTIVQKIRDEAGFT